MDFEIIFPLWFLYKLRPIDDKTFLFTGYCEIVDHGVDGDDSQYWKETALLLRLIDIPSVWSWLCLPEDSVDGVNDNEMFHS